MRLVTLADGRAARLEGDGYVPLPGRLADHLCRPEAAPVGDPIPVDRIAVGPPIARPGKIVLIGLNYKDHAAETGQDLPEAPLLFSKPSSCVVGPGAPIEMPDGDVHLDYEAELAVVISKVGRNIARGDAMAHVFGYTIVND
ncbi:MAG: fumarylacetoacetate hydrolase family protein, partial [Actinomycetota bacterium]